jgi:hypothetical protein
MRRDQVRPSIIRDRYQANAEEVEEFRNLVSRWRRETAHLSSTTKMALHPAYQRIIGMGPAARPLLLEELRQRPAHWFWALNAITGEDPASDDDDFDGAVAAWLRWGEARGLIQ